MEKQCADSREQVRRQGIAARDSLSAEERTRLSRQTAEHILHSPEFQSAGVILLYRGIRGEVRLDALEAAAAGMGKRLAYPVCLPDFRMAAFCPADVDAWTTGRYGIREPLRARSALIPPQALELVLCPCTAFDGMGGRMGMGAGYYDRYLPQCVRARFAAVAFEVQRAQRIPAQPWDRPMHLIYTEQGVFRPPHSVPSNEI